MKNTAICYSMKDRIEFSKKTLPAVLKDADKFDLFIVDGSSTPEGKAYAFDLNTNINVAGVHCNVTGGADVAIVYALSFMLDRNYDYCGLIENDVLLDEGWFDRIMGLFTRNVGSVSARCYSDRILEKGNGFAVMANIGAGMVIFSKEGAETVLDYYRNGSFAEYLFWPAYFTGLESPIPHEIADPRAQYQMTADWFFESSLLSRNLASLACTPGMARSIDQTDELIEKDESVYAGKSPFIVNRTPALISNYDPGIGAFTAQPHQILIALPGAFTGGWKIVWAKHNGPFGMRTEKGELTIPFYGTAMRLLLDIKKDALVEVLENDKVIGSWGKSSGFCAVTFGDAKMRCLTFRFTGEVIVMTAHFTCPQNWFKDGYGLRYAHLAKYF